jgi:hypothetical protein
MENALDYCNAVVVFVNSKFVGLAPVFGGKFETARHKMFLAGNVFGGKCFWREI